MTASEDNCVAASLIDLDHYATQAGKQFSDEMEAYRHFAAEGQKSDLTPSPYFYTRWYRWQRPDSASFPTVLDHFVDQAPKAPVDPAPFIDSVAVLRSNPQWNTALDMLVALVRRDDQSISPRLEDHLGALRRNRERVHNAIRSSILRQEQGDRRRLVWVQAGTAFRVRTWFQPDASRSWDLMCNWYALNHLDLRFGEIHLRQSGTKFTAIHHLLEHYPELLEPYDQILFIDDDLVFDHEDVDRVFEEAEKHELDLFQPSLAPG